MLSSLNGAVAFLSGQCPLHVPYEPFTPGEEGPFNILHPGKGDLLTFYTHFMDFQENEQKILRRGGAFQTLSDIFFIQNSYFDLLLKNIEYFRFGDFFDLT